MVMLLWSPFSLPTGTLTTTTMASSSNSSRDRTWGQMQLGQGSIPAMIGNVHLALGFRLGKKSLSLMAQA
jgi:hypothetical protein